MFDRLRSILGNDAESGEAAEGTETRQTAESTDTQEAVSWMMRVTDKEYKIDDRNEFQYSIETGLNDILSGKEKFLQLTPTTPVNGTVYLKAGRGSDIVPGSFKIEAEKEEADEKRAKYYIETADTEECIKLFSDLYEGWGVKTRDWNKAGQG
ncbi:MAG: hypothetical protein J6X66_04055 [Lachnospiraceae bacterium]|nr:hypothetical protein [Lachnospiraceae bacterium]